MNKLIENAMTIEEKCENYSIGQKVDYSYFEEWRDVRTLLSDRYFDVMLKEMKLSKDAFAFSLQPGNGAIAPTTKNDNWYNVFTEIMNTFEYSKIDYCVGVHLPTLPFNKYLVRQIKHVMGQLKNIKVCDKILDSFIEAHLIEMFSIMGKITAISLEEYKQTNQFESEDKEARFQEFLKNTFFSKDSFMELFDKYPVAARLATVRTMYLIKNYTTLLQNIERDHIEIEQFLKVDKLNLTEIALSIGDSHEQGNSVSILSFDDRKLVYKPKDLSISKSFDEFVEWYVSVSDLLPIKIPKGIYKKDYTYNEFIAPQFCRNEEEVQNFYIRYGYLIALCYLVNLNDLHLENIIAHGEYPVIVDIETAFQVSPAMEKQTIYVDLLRSLEVDSVSNSFLLPKLVSVGINDQVDLSALNGKEVKVSQTFLSPTELNTDQFHYEKVHGYFPGGNNIPRLGESKDVDVKKYSLKILEGFDDFIHFVISHKSDCLEALNVFKGKKIRSLIKTTEKYASMLRYANHPAYNREMKYRERLMMNIWAFPYFDKRIIKSEVRDLLFNDIPIFYSFTDSRDIIDSQGILYKNYHSKSGFELSVDRVKNLTQETIVRQRAILLAALGVYDAKLNQKIQKRDISFTIQKFNYVKPAKQIANKMTSESYAKGNKCSFLSIDCDKNKHWKMVPCDESLYSGLSGIAVFFLELYMRTRQKIYFEYYQRLVNTAIEQTKNTGFQSAFSGWLSPVYPLTLEYRYLSTVSNKKYMDFTIKKLATMKVEDIHKLVESDYISGIAGIIHLLSTSQSTFGKDYINDQTIRNFSEVLRDRVESGKEKAMTKVGIAHGISGIMLGLASGKVVAPEIVRDFLLREFRMKIPQKNIYKWCWGLSGMIQARLKLLEIIPSAIDKKQLNQLIERFHKSLSSMWCEDSLCHGNGSVATTLKMIYEYTHEEKWKSLLQLWMSNIHMNALLDTFKISEIGDIKTKGIFDGISGVGWLYLYSSDQINNILLLEAKEG